jgi:hypothetical protein
MRGHIRIVSAAAAMVVAACGQQSTLDEQMKKDLDAASASTMELAPNGGGQRVVSAIEQVPQKQPTVTKTRTVNTPAKTPESKQVVHSTTEPAAARPNSRPAVQPPPPGGYKTIGEVLRNAPFPIKPLGARASRRKDSTSRQ